MATRLTDGAPSFRVSRHGHSRARALRFLNRKKKRDCSQSRRTFNSSAKTYGGLTICIGKPEIPVGKSNKSRHSVYWEASENMSLACVAVAWKWWAKERTGAREGDTRGVLPLHSRVSFSRARFFLCLLLPSAFYAG